MSAEILFGRTDDGQTVTLEIRLEERTIAPSTRSVEHGPVSPAAPRLSISALIYGPRCREPWAAGQCIEGAAAVTSGPWSAADRARLLEIWRRWHLNDMRAACAHMDLPAETSYEARRHITCPLTGYRYGSAWLAEELPADVLADVRRFMARAGEAKFTRGRKPAAVTA